MSSFREYVGNLEDALSVCEVVLQAVRDNDRIMDEADTVVVDYDQYHQPVTLGDQIRCALEEQAFKKTP